MNRTCSWQFIGILITFVALSSSSVWKWSINEKDCRRNISTVPFILHIYIDKNNTGFSVNCIDIAQKPIKCSENVFEVSYHGGHSAHLVCMCDTDCFQELQLRDNNTIACMKDEGNISFCRPAEFCGGHRAGCVLASSCKNSTEFCTDDLGCCCNEPFCNGWKMEKVIPPVFPESESATIPTPAVLIAIFVSITVFVLVCITMWLLYRFRRRSGNELTLRTSAHREQNEIPLLSNKHVDEEPITKDLPPPLQFTNVKMLDMLSRGQRGTRSVYTASCDGTILAVKYFALNDYASWDAELKIYALPHMKHENLLKFIGYTIGGLNAECSPSDHAIFTEYIPRGSLQDVLKQQEVDWDSLLHIASGMMCGLAYLHSAIPSSDPKNAKPPIAHRDFKSRNVLLKEDLTACVADFGLALPFDSARRTSNCGQVGTLRYMAPEVLDLAVNFSCDAFLRIDVYACGLTLWEILRRCSKQPELIASPVYEQPFETHLNKHYPNCHNHPSLSEMQDIVFVKRLRPDLPTTSSATHHIFDLIVTIEQCWDHDSEARPSAGCVYNRIKRIKEQFAKNSGFSAENSTESVTKTRNEVTTDHHLDSSTDVQPGEFQVENDQTKCVNGFHQHSNHPFDDLSAQIIGNGSDKRSHFDAIA